MEGSNSVWSPLGVEAVVSLFSSAPFPWWIAGGQAIDLFVGRATRAHGDMDVLVLERDKDALRHYLADWDVWAAVPGTGLRPWPPGNTLAPEIHDIWCREAGGSDWRFQVMLDGSASGEWVSRRNADVRMPLERLTRRTLEGIPYVAPEMQLFYKAKAIRPKDELDFDACCPSLDSEQHDWLMTAIRRTYGEDHPWLAGL